MLKRKIESYWIKWKKSEGKKPLVIKDICRCGKIFIVPKSQRRMMPFYSCNFRTCEIGVSNFYSPVRQLFFSIGKNFFPNWRKKGYRDEIWVSCFAFTELFREKQNFLR